MISNGVRERILRIGWRRKSVNGSERFERRKRMTRVRSDLCYMIAVGREREVNWGKTA
jgi:hypothetical protein